MNKEEIKQEPNDGLIARILGGTPTILQKVFFILMEFSLILWPLGCYVSIFFFDAPVRSDVDKICRYGMLITIYLYPIYLFPLLRFMFQLSKNLRATWLYYLCPIVPILILRLLFSISTISAPKIDNTEFCTNEDLVGHWTLSTVAKSLPPLRWNTHKSLILSYSADFSVIFTKNSHFFIILW